MQVTLANWRTAPFNRWAFHHVRELVPSADIANDPRAVRALPAAPLDFKDLDIEAFLRETDTDGIAVVHRGQLVFERYANGMTDETPHILMSVSKSMLGLLVHELGIDTARRVVDLIPELENTAYRDATLRHLLDMRAGIVWDENYLAHRARSSSTARRAAGIRSARAKRHPTCSPSLGTLKETRPPRRPRPLYLAEQRPPRLGDRARHRAALRRADERARMEEDRRRAQRLHHGRPSRRTALRRRHVHDAARSRARRAMGDRRACRGS